MKKKIIIDTDPGIDDAVALAVALFSEELDIKLITTVAGNVEIDKVTENSLKLLTFFNKKIPVAKGASKPLTRKSFIASHVHGISGMDGYDFSAVDRSNLVNLDASEAIHKVLEESAENFTIIAIGPLTNIANLLLKYPESKNKIEKIVLMGGNIGRGNAGIFSEFNFKVDPEAADIVFNSDLELVMCPLEIGKKAVIKKDVAMKIKDLNRTGYMLYSLLNKYGDGNFEHGLRMFDLCAVAYVIKPQLFKEKFTRVDIETKGKFTYGASLVYLASKPLNPNATVLLDINQDNFTDWLMERLKNCI